MFSTKPPFISMFGLSPFRATEICKNNRLASPLLRLPAELRNKIYHYAMKTTDGVVHVRRRPNDTYYLATCSMPNILECDIKFPASHPSNHASRQLRAETKILNYTIHTYEMQTWGVGGLVALLPRPALNAITVVRIPPKWFGGTEELDVWPGVFELRLLAQLPNLNNIILLHWKREKGYLGVSENRKLNMKEAVMTMTGQDLEVVYRRLVAIVSIVFSG